MKKNCFNFKKAMTSVIMLSMVSFTMTSCQDFWDDVFGTEDAPVEDTTTPSDPKEEDQVTIAFTENGAELTVQSLSDVTKLLAPDSVKADIEKKAGEEYIIEIKGEGLTTTSEDNTISVPKVEGSNINLTFSDGITTEEPLVVTAAERKSETSVEAVDAITITVPTSDGLKLEIDMPETSVTLAAESGSVTFDEVISTTATNALYIENGVTVENLQVKDGIVVVKDGGKAETYVYAPKNNDGDEENILGIEPDGVCPTFVWVNSSSQRGWFANVQDEQGNTYYFSNLKVIKGEADYAKVGFYNWQSPIEKLTIGEGAIVKTTGNDPTVNVIEGEGEGAQLIIISDPHVDNDYDWDDENEETVIIKRAHPQADLLNVTEISGISLSIELSDEQQAKDELAEAEGIIYQLWSLPNNLENCTFKADHIYFREGTTTIGGNVESCKFENVNANNDVYINVPPQSGTMPSYKFNFTECSFSEGFILNIIINERIPEYGPEGNPVYYQTPFYRYNDENGREHFVENKSEIPEGAEYEELNWSNFQKFTYAEFVDYYATIAFKNCQAGGSKLTKDSGLFRGYYGSREGVYIRLEIDGKPYKWDWDDENHKWGFMDA